MVHGSAPAGVSFSVEVAASRATRSYRGLLASDFQATGPPSRRAEARLDRGSKEPILPFWAPCCFRASSNPAIRPPWLSSSVGTPSSPEPRLSHRTRVYKSEPLTSPSRLPFHPAGSLPSTVGGSTRDGPTVGWWRLDGLNAPFMAKSGGRVSSALHAATAAFASGVPISSRALTIATPTHSQGLGLDIAAKAGTARDPRYPEGLGSRLLEVIDFERGDQAAPRLRAPRASPGDSHDRTSSRSGAWGVVVEIAANARERRGRARCCSSICARAPMAA